MSHTAFVHQPYSNEGWIAPDEPSQPAAAAAPTSQLRFGCSNSASYELSPFPSSITTTTTVTAPTAATAAELTSLPQQPTSPSLASSTSTSSIGPLASQSATHSPIHTPTVPLRQILLMKGPANYQADPACRSPTTPLQPSKLPQPQTPQPKPIPSPTVAFVFPPPHHQQPPGLAIPYAATQPLPTHPVSMSPNRVMQYPAPLPSTPSTAAVTTLATPTTHATIPPTPCPMPPKACPHSAHLHACPLHGAIQPPTPLLSPLQFPLAPPPLPPPALSPPARAAFVPLPNALSNCNHECGEHHPTMQQPPPIPASPPIMDFTKLEAMMHEYRSAQGSSSEDQTPGMIFETMLLNNAPCNHITSWRRLRAKRGLNHLLCYYCGAKWKTPRMRPSSQRALPMPTPNIPFADLSMDGLADLKLTHL